jgi:hypothetical protein
MLIIEDSAMTVEFRTAIKSLMIKGQLTPNKIAFP